MKYPVNRSLRILIALIAALALTVSCAPAAPAATTAAAATTTAAAATTAAAETTAATEADAAGGADSGETFEFSWFWNQPSHNIDLTTDISVELLKRTNVNIKFERPTTDDNQRLNIIMSSGNLPDVITCDRTLAAVPMMIEAKKVQCLNDLMEQYAPSMLTDIEPEYLQYHKYTDGKNYYWTNYIYTPFVMSRPDYPKIDAVFQASMIRKDVWEAIGQPDVTTPELYIEMLKMAQEQFPDIPTLYFGRFPNNGGLFMNTDSPSWSMLGDFGVHMYDVSSDGKVTSSVRSARWVQAIKFLNEIYRDGCLAAESFVDDNDTWNAKVNNGEVAVFHASIANHAFLPGVEYVPLPYFKDEGSKFVKSGAGWLATMVTSDAKDVSRLMQFFAYIASTEGRRLVSWGIEGRHWEWSKENPDEPVKTAIWDEMEDPADYTEKWGFWQHRALHDQYYCNSLFEKWTPERRAWYELYGDVMELDIFDGVRNPALDDSVEGVILAKLNEHAYVNYPKLIMAANEAEFDKIYSDFIAKCDEMGLPTLEEYWTKRYAQFD